jgi:predicted DsbA family dithiol-disulfide isomerase
MNQAGNEPAVFVEYYTDPLCSWSWAFEAQWRRLRYECAGRLGWRYHMGGLLPNWQSYDDPFNDIGSPTQMGPQWLHVSELSGTPLDGHLWQRDPPASSYPACIAVKAAQCQGQAVEESYLRRLREAVMLEQRNIARQDILLEVAQQTARAAPKKPSLDLDRFSADLNMPQTMEAFRQDLREAAYHGIGRFPTLIVRCFDGHGIVLVGYRPYDVLKAALEHLVPDLLQRSEISCKDLVVDYVTHWQRVTAHEVAEIFDGDSNRILELLESLIAKGALALADDSQSAVPIYIPAL